MEGEERLHLLKKTDSCWLLGWRRGRGLFTKLVLVVRCFRLSTAVQNISNTDSQSENRRLWSSSQP